MKWLEDAGVFGGEMLMRFARRIRDWFVYWFMGGRWAERTVLEFVETFPGRCPVCSFRRHAWSNGVDLPDEPHPCPERPR